MGYTTEFDGRVSVSPPLNRHEIVYLLKFAATRRMDRTRGPYFVDGSGPFGQGRDDDIQNFNQPPAGQPDCGASGNRPRMVRPSSGTARRSSTTPQTLRIGCPAFPRFWAAPSAPLTRSEAVLARLIHPRRNHQPAVSTPALGLLANPLAKRPLPLPGKDL